MEWLISTWYGILLLVVLALLLVFLISFIPCLYRGFFKRFYDFSLSLVAIILLSPLFLILIPTIAIAMKGNPFFTQLRPGKNEKIFKMIKFRSMTNEKDKDGNLLPDEVRLTKFGKILRSTSLDELPELFCILTGKMSIIGPRPLVVKYLDYYNGFEKHRHDVRPGLTGLAQVNGRNNVNWPERFNYDIEYVNNISLANDIKILFRTVSKVLQKENISIRGTGKILDFDEFRRNEIEKNHGES